MTERTGTAGDALRVAVIDTDSGFVQVLTKRMERVGWEHRVIGGPVPTEALVSMRLGAVVVDPVLFGHRAFDELERICSGLPGLAVVVCTGGSTIAQRVRGLRLGADDWVTKPCHPEEVLARREAPGAGGAGGPGAPPQRGARVECAHAGRRGRDQGRPVPGVRGGRIDRS